MKNASVLLGQLRFLDFGHLAVFPIEPLGLLQDMASQDPSELKIEILAIFEVIYHFGCLLFAATHFDAAGSFHEEIRLVFGSCGNGIFTFDHLKLSEVFDFLKLDRCLPRIAVPVARFLLGACLAQKELRKLDYAVIKANAALGARNADDLEI